MKKIQIGQVISKRVFLTVESKQLHVPDSDRLVHLQFRRFAGCPFCSVHLHSFVRRRAELATAGVTEVILFRSTAAELRKHYDAMPFANVADPNGKFYSEFGVATGLRSILSMRPLLTALPNVVRNLPKLPGIPRSGQGLLGLPADFLISPDGRILALNYGRHADDQWSVDELLLLAREHTAVLLN